MAEQPEPRMELVPVEDDVTCLLCNKHVGPFMVEIDTLSHGRIHMCQFCIGDMFEALPEEREEHE